MGHMAEIGQLGDDGVLPVYQATPEGTARGAILVLQEIFGVNAGIRARCDRWAEAGYVALAPDLFWRIEPGIQLDPDEPDHFERAVEYLKHFDRDLAIRDIEATIRAARQDVPGRKVGAVGYCMGGLLAYLSATRTDIDASVAYYGGSIDQFLGEARAIARPLLLHFAEADHFIPAQARAEIDRAVGTHPNVTIHLYPGVDHGFATESGNRRVEDAAQHADARTAAFFAEHLA